MVRLSRVREEAQPHHLSTHSVVRDPWARAAVELNARRNQGAVYEVQTGVPPPRVVHAPIPTGGMSRGDLGMSHGDLIGRMSFGDPIGRMSHGDPRMYHGDPSNPVQPPPGVGGPLGSDPAWATYRP